MIDLLKNLIACDSPPGQEKNVRDLVRETVAPFADEIRVDGLGNLLIRKGEKAKNGLRVMLAAHMDEIGLVATHIAEGGFVRVSNMGGVHGAYAVGQRVRFLNGTQGVIGHEFEGFSGEKISLDKLFVDVGATSVEDCPVQVGDAAVFEGRFQEFGERWTGKALDDRVSVAVLVETLRCLGKSPHELWFVFTTMEEGGRKGAGPAAFGIDPDIGIALDVLTAGDTPKGYQSPVELGKGPALKMMDARLISDPALMQAVDHAATKIGLSMQRAVLKRGATDGSMIQIARDGIPTANLGIPCRYIHSPVEMVDARDVEKTVSLMLQLLENPIKL
jgi:tetrahedral aminopeptidase